MIDLIPRTCDSLSQPNVTQELPRKSISARSRPVREISPIRALFASRKSRTRKRSRPDNPLNYRSYSRAVSRRWDRAWASSTKKENLVSARREKRPNSRGKLSPSLSFLFPQRCRIKSRFVSLAIIRNEIIAESHDANSNDASNWESNADGFRAKPLPLAQRSPRPVCNSLNIAVPNSR